MSHCDRCKGLGDPAPRGEPNPAVVLFVEAWAKANGYKFTRDGDRIARLTAARSR